MSAPGSHSATPVISRPRNRPNSSEPLDCRINKDRQTSWRRSRNRAREEHKETNRRERATAKRKQKPDGSIRRESNAPPANQTASQPRSQPSQSAGRSVMHLYRSSHPFIQPVGQPVGQLCSYKGTVSYKPNQSVSLPVSHAVIQGQSAIYLASQSASRSFSYS